MPNVGFQFIASGQSPILENNNPEEEITEKDQENIEVENSENTEDNILLAENEDIENINSGDQDK